MLLNSCADLSNLLTIIMISIIACLSMTLKHINNESNICIFYVVMLGLPEVGTLPLRLSMCLQHAREIYYYSMRKINDDDNRVTLPCLL